MMLLFMRMYFTSYAYTNAIPNRTTTMALTDTWWVDEISNTFPVCVILDG